MLEFGNRAAILDIGCVAAGTEDAANFHGLVGVGGGDKCTSSIVDQGSNGDGESLDERSVYIITNRIVPS